jgi:hypothetical protein
MNKSVSKSVAYKITEASKLSYWYNKDREQKKLQNNLHSLHNVLILIKCIVRQRG